MENFKTALLFDAEGDISQRWYVYYYFRNPDTGKFQRFRQWVPLTAITKSSRYLKAKEMIQATNTKLRQGFSPFSDENHGRINIFHALNYIREKKFPSLRKRTIQSYRSYLKFFEKFLLNHKYKSMAIEDFNFSHAQEFMDWYQETHEIGNRTYNNLLLSIRACFNFLIKRRFILINPFLQIEYLPVDQPGIIRFEEWERKVICERLPECNFNLYIISQLVFGCSLRPQEIVRLQRWHINTTTGQIEIPGKIAKNHKSRTLDIPVSVLTELRKMDLDFPANFYVFAKDLKPGPKQNHPTRISDAWRSFAQDHGITKGIYGLKHTANGLALEGGSDIREIQLHNRHSSLTQTQKYLERFRVTTSEKFRDNFPSLDPSK